MYNLKEMFHFFISHKTEEELKSILTSDFVIFWSIATKNIDVIERIAKFYSEEEYLEFARTVIKKFFNEIYYRSDFIQALVQPVIDIRRTEILTLTT